MAAAALKIGDEYISKSGLSYIVQPGQTSAVTKEGVVKTSSSSPVSSSPSSTTTKTNYLTEDSLKLNTNNLVEGIDYKYTDKTLYQSDFLNVPQIPKITEKNITNAAIGIDVTPKQQQKIIKDIIEKETTNYIIKEQINPTPPTSILDTIFGSGDNSGTDTIKNNVIWGLAAVAGVLILITVIKK